MRFAMLTMILLGTSATCHAQAFAHIHESWAERGPSIGGETCVSFFGSSTSFDPQGSTIRLWMSTNGGTTWTTNLDWAGAVGEILPPSGGIASPTPFDLYMWVPDFAGDIRLRIIVTNNTNGMTTKKTLIAEPIIPFP